jgi:hypothetical protein
MLAADKRVRRDYGSVRQIGWDNNLDAPYSNMRSRSSDGNVWIVLRTSFNSAC